MVFRIRFKRSGEQLQKSETVEANSPAEAMFKFQAMHDRGPLSRQLEVVTSVCAEESILIT